MSAARRAFTTETQRHRGNRFSCLFLGGAVTFWLIVFVLPSVSAAQNITFRDITAPAGIHFTHNNGAFGKKWLPETLGPGCAFIDYDNDGWPDILLVNGTDWLGHATALGKNGASTLKLYHNNHDGQPRLTRHIGKSAVVIVVIKLQSTRAVLPQCRRMPQPVRSIH